jgi:hypothetical protein
VLDQFAPTFTHGFAERMRSAASGRAALRRVRGSSDCFACPRPVLSVATCSFAAGCGGQVPPPLISVGATVAGRAYENEVAQTIELRWGRITRFHNLQDTQKLAVAPDRLAVSGLDEARSAP